MKRKTIILAVVAAAAMALSLVGCGVKITNIAVPESAMVEKGESITLPVVYGTDDAPAVSPETAATGESAETDEKLAKAASKLTVEWTSSDESVATVDATGMVQPSNPEPAAPAPAQPDPQPSNPEPPQPSGGDSGSTENKPNGSDGWEWGGPVISTPTDNGCPPEEHAGGLC